MKTSGVLLDLDGTVYESGRVIPGAASALEEIRARGIPVRFVTNTTRLPRPALVERLRGLGLAAEESELFTAPRAAALWLAEHGIGRVAPFIPEPTWHEFGAFAITFERPDAVVMGDLGEAWTFDRMNQAFRLVLGGAKLVALQKNRYWKVADGLVLDTGPYVAAIEYATGVRAQVIGKPSPEFFEAVARSLGRPAAELVMVGDDPEADVAGAQSAGCRGVLVRTGKYRPGDEALLTKLPDAVLASVADLPAWLFR